ncbi:class I adenylate-forming enzyme family protein [Euzebya tangerina]|uniref:class I adenylate-forming enzyme family protein n=1 Tax=Euzebya tangerina TaxID=591198 RepID=UPI00196B2A3B|nr:AMP-binding protein [Euzebya tangerina]
MPDRSPTSAGRLLLAVPATATDLLPHLEAAWDGGPAILPLDPRLPLKRRSALLAGVNPGAVVKPDGPVTLPFGVDVPDDVVAVVPTSGSTGHPKAVMLTRHALEASVRRGLDRTDADPDVPWLCCLPVSHIAGLLVLLRGIVTGTPAILHDTFDPDRIAALDQPVHLAVVPTMLRRLVAAGVAPDRHTTVLVGGARVPEVLRQQVPHLTATYGMTETAGGCVYDGIPLAGVEVSESDAGRLVIGGPTVMAGYHLPGAGVHGDGIGLTPDGRFETEDVGRVAPDGTVEVLGRADDVIITGGEKVVAAQVAARIEEHPAVVEAVVIGVPDEEWGQRVVAVVVPAQVGAILSLALLRSFVADAMPRYAAPQDLVVTNTLPRLPNGKLDRQNLVRSVADR